MDNNVLYVMTTSTLCVRLEHSTANFTRIMKYVGAKRHTRVRYYLLMSLLCTSADLIQCALQTKCFFFFQQHKYYILEYNYVLCMYVYMHLSTFKYSTVLSNQKNIYILNLSSPLVVQVPYIFIYNIKYIDISEQKKKKNCNRMMVVKRTTILYYSQFSFIIFTFLNRVVQ